MRYSGLVDRVAGQGADVWKVHMDGVHMQQAGTEVFFLTVGEPDQAPPPAIIEATIAALRRQHTGYAMVLGDRELRKLIATRVVAKTTQACTFENVVIVPGAQSGLYFVMQCLVGVGDEVIVPEPMYATYEAVCGASGATMVRPSLRSDAGFHLDLDALQRAITPRTRVIWLNSPHNPTGAVLRRDELEAVAAMCRKHDLWLLSDEVYEQLAYGSEHVSAWSLPDMQDRTVVVSSLSKSHAVPGFRIGWTIGPAELTEHLFNLLLCGTYGGVPFLQDGAMAAFQSELPEALEMKAIYKRRAAKVVALLQEAPRCRVIAPEGGMFVVLDVRGTGLPAETFAQELLKKQHVAVLACDGFGPSGVGHVRISLTLKDDKLEEAVRRIGRFAAEL